MGRPKKIPKKPAPKKCKKIVYRVLKDKQWADFDSCYNARQHLIKCLENGAVTFCSIDKIEVEGC